MLFGSKARTDLDSLPVSHVVPRKPGELFEVVPDTRLAQVVVIARL